jgi:hypothetical protein
VVRKLLSQNGLQAVTHLLKIQPQPLQLFSILLLESCFHSVVMPGHATACPAGIDSSKEQRIPSTYCSTEIRAPSKYPAASALPRISLFRTKQTTAHGRLGRDSRPPRASRNEPMVAAEMLSVSTCTLLVTKPC